MGKDRKDGFEEWDGYMNAKITKLEEQFSKASDPFRQTELFKGISIYVNGHTNPSADELKRIMMVHSGVFHHYERSHTTFIIASNLPDVKIRNMNTSKIISPQWVVDCVSAQKIVDYSKYLLYTNQSTSQPKITFQKVEKDDEPKASNVSSIMRDLAELNAKMKETKPDISPEPKQSGSAMTAVDPKFLSEFYNNSRLHHIATLGAGFKKYVSDLRDKHNGDFPDRQKLKEILPKSEIFVKNGQTVMHIDMDCFFVSVGLRKRPHLRGKPVAVTHSKGKSEHVPLKDGVNREKEMDLFVKKIEKKAQDNVKASNINSFSDKSSLSEVASCSYEARAKGVKNGMFMGLAMKLCPGIQAIPYDFEAYKEVAETLYNTVAQYTLNIEAVSCDEMFVDLTDLLNDVETTPMDFVTALRNEVKEKTGCPCSAGVGSNRLQARMATKKAKPDGQFHLLKENVEEYFQNIAIKELPGVGSSTSYTLNELNWKTCGDLQTVSLYKIQAEFGKKFGETLHQFCRGIDNRPLVYGQIRKSVSAEVNYGIRFKENAECETFLKQLCVEVHARLMDIKRKGKCITLKVMVRAPEAPVETSKFMGHGVCDNQTKSVSLTEFTCDLEVITRTVLSTMRSLNIPPHELRGIGIQITKLNEEAPSKKDSVLMNMFSKVAEKQKDKPLKPKETVVEVDKKSEEKSIKGMFSKMSESTKIKSEEEKKPKTKKKNQPTGNIMGMLQNMPSRKRTSDYLVPDDIDESVLAELPEDIRREILQARSDQQKSIEERVKARITKSVKDKKEEIEEIQEEEQEPNIFLQKDNCRILLAWMQSCDEPDSYDVELIIKNAIDLITRKESHEIYDPIAFMCR
ncbi:REV1 family protein [Megaselia abdita]